MLQKKNMGLFAMLLLFFVHAVMCTMNYTYHLPEAVLITVGLLLVLALALLGRKNVSVVLSVGITVGFIAYYMVRITKYHAELDVAFFIWASVPILFGIAVAVYQSGLMEAERELQIKLGKEEDRILVSAETGLYNAQCLYNDLRMQQAYCERNHKVLTLMEIKVALPGTTKRNMTIQQLTDFYREIGVMLTDLLRVEDRVYSIEDGGKYGILLICNQEQSEVVTARMLRTLGNQENYRKLLKENDEVHVQVASLEYDKGAYGEDFILFERELRGKLV